jgi:putative oxidoreductase
MKNQRLIFWISTGLFSAFMLFSAYNYLAVESMKAAFAHIGFPDYFRVQLGIAKLMGALALIIPGVPRLVKMFTYAGFTINLVSAFILHLTLGDSLSAFAPILFIGLILGLSYYSYNKLQSSVIIG